MNDGSRRVFDALMDARGVHEVTGIDAQGHVFHGDYATGEITVTAEFVIRHRNGAFLVTCPVDDRADGYRGLLEAQASLGVRQHIPQGQLAGLIGHQVLIDMLRSLTE